MRRRHHTASWNGLVNAITFQAVKNSGGIKQPTDPHWRSMQPPNGEWEINDDSKHSVVERVTLIHPTHHSWLSRWPTTRSHTTTASSHTPFVAPLISRVHNEE
jgi:hypothetical protein